MRYKYINAANTETSYKYRNAANTETSCNFTNATKIRKRAANSETLQIWKQAANTETLQTQKMTMEGFPADTKSAEHGLNVLVSRFVTHEVIEVVCLPSLLVYVPAPHRTLQSQKVEFH